MELTRKQAEQITRSSAVYGPGYCSEQDYCKSRGISRYDLIVIGSNHGLYGWNWTLYRNPANGDYIISSYRNCPNLNYIKI